MRSSEVCPSPPLPDDKNGYQHVLLHSSSQTSFDFQWQGFYFVFRTLPFGWKTSAFISHKLGLAVSGDARSIGVPVSQYNDDRHVSQLFSAPLWMTQHPSFQRALAATYIMCSCSLRRVILLVSASRSLPLRRACVFSVSYLTRCVKLSL